MEHKKEFHRHWLFHKTNGAVLVESEEQLKALGSGYRDHPFESDHSDSSDSKPSGKPAKAPKAETV